MNSVKVRLREIVTVKNGSTPSTTNPNYYDGDIIWITPKDLSNQSSRYISHGERSITAEGLASCSSSLLPKGTVLMSSRAPIGLLSIAEKELCTNQGFKNLIPKSERITSEFLYYLLRTKISDIEKIGSGTTFKEVSKSSIEDFELIVPYDISDQQKIASVLSALDSKIELNNRINAELEAMAKTIYDYWFVQFDFPDERGKPYKSSGGKMVWNEELKREIPEGWEVNELGNHIELFDSKRVPLSSRERSVQRGSIPYYGATGVMDYVSDYIFDGDYILLA
jgi:type I restriction enzyme S subunit